MRKILTALVALVSLFATVPAVMPADVTGHVTVQPWCEINASPTSLNFLKGVNNLIPGDTSDSLGVIISMPKGNQPTIPLVSGTQWTGTVITPPTMSVGQTGWSAVLGNSGQLSGTEASIGVAVSHGTSRTVNFNVAIPVDQAADSYTQTITITACGEQTTTTTIIP